MLNLLNFYFNLLIQIAAVAAYLFYPFALELFMLFWEKFIFSIKDYKKFHYQKHLQMKKKLGIVCKDIYFKKEYFFYLN